MTTRIKSALLALLALSNAAESSEIFYYGETARELEISSHYKTLLVFPAPPYTYSCQPSSIVDLRTLASVDEAEAILPDSTGYQYMDRLRQARQAENQMSGKDKERDELAASLLELTPVRPGGETVCAVRLVSGETVTARFILSNQVFRPSVEFHPMSEAAAKASAMVGELGGLAVFRDLLQGGDLTYLVNTTPRQRSHTSTLAYYTVEYTGTDHKSFKAWRVRVKARDKMPLSSRLKTDHVGQLLFSAWLDTNGQSAKAAELAKGETAYLYLLSSHDLSQKELWRKLP